MTFDGAAVNIAVGNFVSSRMTRTGETDTITASSGTLVNDGKHAVIYRGTENPFGNGWKSGYRFSFSIIILHKFIFVEIQEKE